MMILYGLFKFMPTPLGAWGRKFCIKHSAKSCGKNLVIQPGVVIRYPENLELGDDVNINDYCYLNCNGGIKIGNGVRIAPGAKLFAESHNFSSRKKPIFEQGYTYEPIEISDDVWIGANAVILMGIKIGKGAIVAAGCVVTKDIGDWEIHGGVPNKLIKMR